MANHICPWWLAPFALDFPLRRWLHDPQKIVGPYVKPGMTVLDVGCGSGWFSIPMAKMVGDRGKVIAVDIQPQMLNIVRRRAKKADVDANILTLASVGDCADIQADFALAFAMLHEVEDQRSLLSEIHNCLKPGGVFLLAEPPMHVSARTLANEIQIAESVGFQNIEHPRVRWSRAVLLEKVRNPAL